MVALLSSHGTIFATDPGSNTTLVRQSGAWFWHLGKRSFLWNCKAVKDMGVSKNSGTPKWMVYTGNPIRMDDLGVLLFLETPTYMKWKGHILRGPAVFMTRSRQQITRFPNRQHEYQPWTQLKHDVWTVREGLELLVHRHSWSLLAWASICDPWHHRLITPAYHFEAFNPGSKASRVGCGRVPWEAGAAGAPLCWMPYILAAGCYRGSTIFVAMAETCEEKEVLDFARSCEAGLVVSIQNCIAFISFISNNDWTINMNIEKIAFG